MNTARMMALFKREMKDILRDRKTLVMMVVVPLLLYPLIIVGMTLIMSAVSADQLDTTYQISLYDFSEEETQALAAIIDDKSKIDYNMDFVECGNPETDLVDEKIHAYILKEESNGQTAYSVHYLSASDDSSTAAHALMDAFEYYREDIRLERVEESGLSEKDLLYPISYELKDASSNEESVGNYLGTMIPMLVITSICLGAIYPAIDVTAGEKERGTLETLLTLPVTNFEMIMSKFMAVAILASVSAVLNILSMGAAFIFMFKMMGVSSEFELELATFVPAIAFLLLVVIFFAFFVTAVCMCTCIFAKSFKEANNYITPVLFVFMFGGYAAIIPDLELNATTAALPVINMSMMMKSLFSFEYNYPLYGIVLVSNVVYSILVIMALAKIYNSESVLFSEGFTSLKIFAKRSEMKKGQLAGVGDAIFLLCIVLIMMFYVGTFATMKWGIYGVGVQQLMILLIPILYAIYLKCDLKKMFALRMPKVKHVIGGIVLWVGVFGLNIIMSYGLSFIFTDSAQNVQETFSAIYDSPFAIVLFITAVAPAIAEELLFRGFTYTTIRQKCKPYVTMLIVSAIFGLYHLSLIKFFTTALLGFALAYLKEKSDSIFPGMLFHFLNNALAAVASIYPEKVEKVCPILMQESLNMTDIVMIVLVAIVLIAIACVLLRKGEQKQTVNK